MSLHTDMVLFEGIQQILWVLRPDGSVERFNPYWTTYTGLPQQMEALTWADVFHPDDRARLVEVRTRGVAEEKPYVVDARMRRADGAYRWHRCQVTPLFKDGRLTAWIGTALDIEDLRQAEFKAQESERQKRIVLETINEGYYRLDREWRFVDVNHVFEAMSGKSREEILGQRVWDIFPDAQGASDYEAVASDEPAAVYERYSRPIGRWFEVTVSRSEDGVETYFRDIDDRKRAEARQAALVDLGDRLRELTAATDADVAELAAATIGKTLALLRVGYAVTSIDDDTAVVERDWVTDPEVARSAGTYRVSEWGSYLDPLRRGETVLIDNVRGDPRTLAAAEGWVAWDTQAAAFVPLMQDGQLSAYMFLHAGTPHRWTNDEVGFVSNVLDRAWAAVRRLRADAAVRELNANLETLVEERTRALLAAEEQLRQAQKMEAIGQLTGGVAHDFNNLLTIVRSSVDFLRRPNLPEERRVRYIDAITDTVSRAAKLTGQLLAFARRQALKPEVFDVAERIHAVTDMLRTIVGARIEIVTDIACRRCFVEADASQFETALINIAVNARDAMDGEGRLTLAVKIHSTLPPLRRHGGSPGRFVAVSLTDTGCGIPADKLPHVFEPFFTTKEVGKGTGLGLSQVYGFAKQSGGDVAVESKVGHGTSLTLFLPQVDTEPGEIETVSDSLAPEDGRGRRVLLVEDNKDVGAFSTQLLQDLGYETRWAANAAEALQILEDDSDVDAVFSDVVMPGMSGIELGREIRRRWPRLPVVLTSGYSHVLAEEGRHGFELLQKPYAADELSRTLRQVMRRT